MINARQFSAPAGSTRPSRLWPKLAALFGVTFIAFLMVFVAYDVFTGFAERAATSSQAGAQVTPVVIDPRLATDLATVLATDPNTEVAVVKDPFTDRAGLSGTVGNIPVSGGSQSSASTSGTTTGGGSSAQTSPVTGGSISNPSTPALSATEGTRQRYNEWLERFGMSGAPLDPRVFAIDDLLPVGIVDGGKGEQEVMFYSEAAGKTISFPIGTLFFDGWLSELRPEGVVFSFNDYGRTVRMRSWARSLKTG